MTSSIFLQRSQSLWQSTTRTINSLRTPAALQQHITRGDLLASLVLFGLGKWTINRLWIRPRVERRLLAH